MKIRLADKSDLPSILVLFDELHNSSSSNDEAVHQAWNDILEHKGTHVFCVESESEIEIVSTVTLHVLPNLTYGGRPYGLIENVVTKHSHRNKGLGQAVMKKAIDQAWSENCYKIMLLTGKKREASAFYTKLGFSSDEKHGMIIRSDR